MAGDEMGCWLGVAVAVAVHESAELLAVANGLRAVRSV